MERRTDDGATVAATAKIAPGRIDGVAIGLLVGLDEAGTPLVLFAGSPATRPLPARATVPLGANDIGAEVALMFEGGDPMLPLVLGRLVKPGAAPRPEPKPEVTADGGRLELSAEREVVIRCGKASITLTRAGKVLIRGTYLFSRSSGVNKIRGGSVQLN